MKKTLLLLLVGVQFVLHANQLSYVDSLQHYVDEHPGDTNSVNSLLAITEFYYLDQPEISKDKALEAEELAIQLNFYPGIAKSYDWLGYIAYMQGEIDLAIDYFDRSYEIWELLNSKFNSSNALNSLATIYMYQGHIPKALETYHKALKIQEETEDKSGISYTLGNLAALYGYQKDYDKAMEYNFKCLKLREELQDTIGLGTNLNNIGFLHQDLNHLDSALYYYQQALNLFQAFGHRLSVAKTYQNIGTTYQEMGRYEEALEVLEISISIKEEFNDKEGLANSYFAIGEIKLLTGDLNKAQYYGELSMDLAKTIGFPNLIRNAAGLLKEVYAKKGRFQDAYSMLEIYVQMKDSVNNQDNEKLAFRQGLQYEFDKEKLRDSVAYAKEQEILDAQIKKKEAENDKQRLQTYYLYGGLGLTLFFAVFIFNRFKVTNRQKAIIEDQKKIVDEKNTEILDSINYARRIQSAILPPDARFQDHIPDSFILYLPKDIVAGDFYWLEEKNNITLLAVADCTGHGVPGAMVSVVCNNGLNRSVREHGLTDPGDILNMTRDIVIEEFEKSDLEVRDGMDIALVALEHSVRSESQGEELEAQNSYSTLHFAGANNPLWIIRKTDGQPELIILEPTKQPIGKFDHPEPFKSTSVRLKKGDLIYLFSDGFADQFGGDKGKKLKSRGLKDLLFKCAELDTCEQKEYLLNFFEDWKGQLEQIDDVCVIGVRV